MAEFGSANQRIDREDAFNQASSSGFDNSQLSTRKVARVAMLKTRFAGIISKAQQILDKNEENEDPTRLITENTDVVQNQQKKKRRIVSKLTDVKAATITNMENFEIKKNSNMERNLAFLALEKDKINQDRMQQEKEDFAEKQQEKNRGITVQVKAIEAIRNKSNPDRKRKIEKEREAARYALEKVEASIYVDDFNKTYKEFMTLISS